MLTGLLVSAAALAHPLDVHPQAGTWLPVALTGVEVPGYRTIQAGYGTIRIHAEARGAPAVVSMSRAGAGTWGLPAINGRTHR